MICARFVPFFVTYILILGTLSAHADTGVAQQGPVNFSMRMAGLQNASPNSKPLAALDSSVGYDFYRSYTVGVDFSYLRVFNEVDGNISKGVDDLTFYVADKELWANHFANRTLSARLGLIVPTSEDSKTASMRLGGSQSLAFRQGFGGRLATTYTLGATEYSYEFNTAVEDDEATVYNTRVRVLNKIILAYDILRDFHVQTGGSVRTYNDYSGQTYNIYALSMGFSVDMEKYAVIDFGVSTAMKNADANATWNGPSVSDHLFGPEGMLFYFGTTIKI